MKRQLAVTLTVYTFHDTAQSYVDVLNVITFFLYKISVCGCGSVTGRKSSTGNCGEAKWVHTHFLTTHSISFRSFQSIRISHRSANHSTTQYPVTQAGTVFASHRITQLPRVTQCHFLLFLLRLFFLDFDSPSPSPSVSEDDEDEDEDEDEEDEELSDSLPDESLVEDEDDDEELLLLLLLLLSESESDELLSLLELSPSDL